MFRPKLDQVSLKEAFKEIGKPGFTVTMSIGQWDKFLEEAYFYRGAVLIELDSLERPVAAYKRTRGKSYD